MKVAPDYARRRAIQKRQERNVTILAWTVCIVTAILGLWAFKIMVETGRFHDSQEYKRGRR